MSCVYATDLPLRPTLVRSVVNLKTNRCVRVLGKPETTVRFLHLALYQGRPVKMATALTMVSNGLCGRVRGR